MAASWQWQDDRGWTDFDPTSSGTLESLFKSDPTGSVLLRPIGAPSAYKVSLATMQQTNMRSGFPRRVRRVAAAVQVVANPVYVQQIAAMGFDARQVRRALELSKNDSERAVEILVTSPPKIDTVASQERAVPSFKRQRSGSTSASSASAVSASRPNTVAFFAKDLSFGPAAFGPLSPPAFNVGGVRNDYQGQVAQMLAESVDGVASMRGQRGQKTVTTMISDCYAVGLFMFGSSTSPVNGQVVPAIRHIFAECAKLPPRAPRRVAILTSLAEACLDCQQVQARVIMRQYSDLTAQTVTLEQQLKYSLVAQKEVALNRFITANHAGCDFDHTRVRPHQQRAHLISAYVALIGEEFGLDNVVAAQSDRFLTETTNEVRASPRDIIDALRRDMDVREWLQSLLSDINNQNDGAQRLIDRKCIFDWARRNMSADAAHTVFYDEERSEEFSDLDPKQPEERNKYEPFLSPKVVCDILVKASMLQRASRGTIAT